MLEFPQPVSGADPIAPVTNDGENGGSPLQGVAPASRSTFSVPNLHRGSCGKHPAPCLARTRHSGSYSLSPTDIMSPSPGGEEVCKALSCSPGSWFQESSFSEAVSMANLGSVLPGNPMPRTEAGADRCGRTAPGPGPARLLPWGWVPRRGAQPTSSATLTLVCLLRRLLPAPMWQEQLCR